MEQPIKFRTTTAAALSRLPVNERREKLARLCLSNAQALLEALRYCAGAGIGCFRVLSQVLPLATHPALGYSIGDLPDGEAIEAAFRRCGRFAAEHDLRTTFHPDQFVVLNSPRAEVVESSIAELRYQAEVAEWIGADVINIHAGGAYGDKAGALSVLQRRIEQLPSAVRRRLTLENDDSTYATTDLLPVCRATGVPLVYDVHHHRCHSDELTIEQATAAAIATWDREPLFHVSSPRDGWGAPRRQPHHDYIDTGDFPVAWRGLPITVEVEAKAKELAVCRLRDELRAIPV